MSVNGHGPADDEGIDLARVQRWRAEAEKRGIPVARLVKDAVELFLALPRDCEGAERPSWRVGDADRRVRLTLLQQTGTTHRDHEPPAA